MWYCGSKRTSCIKKRYISDLVTVSSAEPKPIQQMIETNIFRCENRLLIWRKMDLYRYFFKADVARKTFTGRSNPRKMDRLLWTWLYRLNKTNESYLTFLFTYLKCKNFDYFWKLSKECARWNKQLTSYGQNLNLCCNPNRSVLST